MITKNKLSKGFTLIELLIVMAVLAILLGMAIPSIRGMQTMAKESRAQGDLKVIKTALESFYMTENRYPTEGEWSAGILVQTVPRIMPKMLKDPFKPEVESYYYSVDPVDDYFVVSSRGENGNMDVDINDVEAGTLEVKASWDDIYTTNALIVDLLDD